MSSVILTNTRENRKTRVFKVSDFIRVSNTKIGQVKGFFTHQLGSQHRIFAVIEPTDRPVYKRGIIRVDAYDGEDLDPIIQVPRFCLSGETIIIGLPKIDSQRLYVTATKEAGQFWCCDWDAYFM